MFSPDMNSSRPKLSVVIPCYNEEQTLQLCVKRVLALQDVDLEVEIVIVDDCSRDGSLRIARALETRHPEVRVFHHALNQGKGAALRTGFRSVSGDYVAVQDADLEYEPQELRNLIGPLRAGHADVVIGSRFRGGGTHRILYFWHSVGNAFLTLLSNMFTDLNLSDMESCYKVFKREVIQSIDIEENRFGFEPEIVAKLAHRKLRIYEMSISYWGRTYEEGKKITWKDGIRALYCIFHYNSYNLPMPIQFLAYLVVGSLAGLVNLVVFLGLLAIGVSLMPSTGLAFVVAAAVNYFLCIAILFRHKARWNSATEALLYILVVAATGLIDLGTTKLLIAVGQAPWLAKSSSSFIGLFLNYLGRRLVVFPQSPNNTMKPSSLNLTETASVDEQLD
jgi:glycosyltransferase involved in cell wall biosynthesis